MVVYASDSIENRAGAYALLTTAVQTVWGFEELPELERTEDGKPYFPDFPEHHFNLSHSEPYALCALDDAPVGADIQIVKPNWREGLPARVCSPEQLRWLEEQDDRRRSFALLWALKEARVKYTGTGLRVGIREISVPLPNAKETLYRHDGLWFRVYRGEDWMAAVCGENPPPEQLIWT